VEIDAQERHGSPLNVKVFGERKRHHPNVYAGYRPRGTVPMKSMRLPAAIR
jgi:hypothetical protein